MLEQFAGLDNLTNYRKEVIPMLFLFYSLFRKEVTIKTSSIGDENALKVKSVRGHTVTSGNLIVTPSCYPKID